MAFGSGLELGEERERNWKTETAAAWTREAREARKALKILVNTWKNVSVVSLARFEGSSVFQGHQVEGAAAGEQAASLWRQGKETISASAPRFPK